jgi:hypothetical protein
MAAEQGNIRGQYKIAYAYNHAIECYYRGYQVNGKVDHEKAYFWASLAASKDSLFTFERDEIAAKLTPEQIAAVKKRVAEWKPQLGSSHETTNIRR